MLRTSLRFVAAVGGVICLAASPAYATPEFPAVVKAELELDFTPACNMCHVGKPGPGTVTSAFGTAMRERGLVPFDEETLEAALAKVGEDAVDSDANGVTDIDQIKAGLNPNDATKPLKKTTTSTTTSTEEPDDGPRTGCGAHVAPRPHGRDVAFPAVALALGMALVARVRRRR